MHDGDQMQTQMRATPLAQVARRQALNTETHASQAIAAVTEQATLQHRFATPLVFRNVPAEDIATATKVQTAMDLPAFDG